MIPLIVLTSVSADLNALGDAVQRCDRAVVNPVFSSEIGRRSRFLLDSFREQEALISARRDLADRRRMLREAGADSGGADEQKLDLESAAINDRQQALNDSRMLERSRQETVDELRRYFLVNCPAGRNGK